MLFHPIINIHNYAAIAFTLLFLYQALLNYSIYKQKTLDDSFMKAHIGLCTFSAFYTFISFLMVWKFSLNLNLYFLHLMWISGSLVTYFYIKAVKFYLNDHTENLKYIGKIPLFGAVGAAFSLLVKLTVGLDLFVDPLVPYVEYKNIYLLQIGGFNPHAFVKFLSVLVLIPTIYSAVYFLNTIRKSKTPHRLLALGIGLDFVIIINDSTISFTDPVFLVPLMFLANFFEIIRITHSNQLEIGKRLNQVTQDLIQTSKLSDAGVYYAFLAHEILNPLNAAQGYFQLIVSKLKSLNADEELQRYARVIERQHERIEVLAKNVKKYTKISLDDEPKVVDIKTIIQDAVDTIHLRALKERVTLNPLVLQDGVQVRCHQDQLVQVFTNLLNNSIEAIAHEKEKWIVIQAELNSKNKIVISIKDSGKGIPVEIQDKIWESRFSTKKEIGMGLGLSICNTIIKNHGGSIRLNTEANNTEFLIEIPVT